MASINLLIRKLEGFHALSQDDKELLERHSRPLREIPAKQDIIREGDTPDDVFLILSALPAATS